MIDIKEDLSSRCAAKLAAMQRAVLPVNRSAQRGALIERWKSDPHATYKAQWPADVRERHDQMNRRARR
ncbi:MAG: hypothetical protein KIT60_20115 [Burkholderiaceae bacterium]|nr:hypothetical protein [Burkholderiaceae bacterium]